MPSPGGADSASAGTTYFPTQFQAESGFLRRRGLLGLSNDMFAPGLVPEFKVHVKEVDFDATTFRMRLPASTPLHSLLLLILKFTAHPALPEDVEVYMSKVGKEFCMADPALTLAHYVGKVKSYQEEQRQILLQQQAARKRLEEEGSNTPMSAVTRVSFAGSDDAKTTGTTTSSAHASAAGKAEEMRKPITVTQTNSRFALERIHRRHQRQKDDLHPLPNADPSPTAWMPATQTEKSTVAQPVEITILYEINTLYRFPVTLPSSVLPEPPAALPPTNGMTRSPLWRRPVPRGANVHHFSRYFPNVAPSPYRIFGSSACPIIMDETPRLMVDAVKVVASSQLAKERLKAKVMAAKKIGQPN